MRPGLSFRVFQRRNSVRSDDASRQSRDLRSGGRAVPLLRGNRRFRGDGSARFAAFLDIILTLLVDAQGIRRR
jgi:hypothetical protein